LENFADILGECYPQKKILLDLSHLPAAYNGSSEYTLHLLEYLAPMLEETYEFSIAVSRPFDLLFSLSSTYDNVLFYEEIREKRFDLVFVPHQIFGLGHLSLLNHIAPRWIVTMHDSISLRCNALHASDTELSATLVTKYGDGIICISNAARKDMKEYLGEEALSKSTVIYHGYSEKKVTFSEDTNIPFQGNFFLLVGNHFSHKAVGRTLKSLPSHLNIVVLGGEKQKSVSRANTHVIVSGQTPESEIATLYKHCKGIIFPSQYEGFGLPLLHAAQYGKHVIACDTESNREIAKELHLENAIKYFSVFPEIATLCDAILSEKEPLITSDSMQRTWKDTAQDTAQYIEEVLRKPVDTKKLQERFALLKELERKQHEAEYYKKSFLTKSLQKTALRVGKQLQPYPRIKKNLRSVAKAMRLPH